MENARYVAVVVGKPLQSPFNGSLPVYAIVIEQVACAHDILIAVMFRIRHTLCFQLVFDGTDHPFQSLAGPFS